MSRQALLVSAFLLFLNVSLVLCREDYQQYYSNHFSHHHRKSTPGDAVSTEAPVSSDEGVSASGGPVFAAVKTTGDITDKQHGYGDFDDYSYRRETRDMTIAAYNAMVISVVVSVLVSAAFLVIGLVIIFCCGKNIGRKVRPGYVFHRPAVGGQPQQPAFADSPHQIHNPPATEMQKVPPPYMEQPAPQLYPTVQQQPLS